jgi:hypothetical protein
MASVKANPFPEITDYWGAYSQWKQIKLPNGEVVYELPGHPGYIFNPAASNATGNIVIRPNPTDQINDEQQQKEYEEKAREQAEFNNSPAGQLLPVAAGTAGTVIGINALAPSAAAAATPAAIAAAAPSAVAGTGAALTGGTAAAIPGAAAAPIASGTAATTAAPAAAGIGGLGVLPMAGIAAGALLAGKAGYDMLRGDKPNIIGRGVLGMATGGLSEVANATGILGHKSTRERQSDVTSDLLEQAGDDQNAINYVTGMREQFKTAPEGKAFHGGDYGSWQEYEAAGLDAGDLTGVEGNIDTYTPQKWAGYNEEQRKAITQKNIDTGNYYSADGGVKIKDKELAIKNEEEALAGFKVNPAQVAAGAPARSTTSSPGIGLDGLPIKKLTPQPNLRR